LTVDGTVWNITCGQDDMTDTVDCIVTNDNAGFSLMFPKGASKPVGLKVTKHDYPGETAMIRVGKDKPFTSDRDGWVTDPALFEQLLKGGVVKTRLTRFPNKVYEDRETAQPISGLDDAISLMQHLQIHFGQISFIP
jgi:hypothetical protein